MTARDLYDLGIGPSDELSAIIAVCSELEGYCLIGGLALNCYLEPVFTADADFAVATRKAPTGLRGFFKESCGLRPIRLGNSPNA